MNKTIGTYPNCSNDTPAYTAGTLRLHDSPALFESMLHSTLVLVLKWWGIPTTSAILRRYDRNPIVGFLYSKDIRGVYKHIRGLYFALLHWPLCGSTHCDLRQFVWAPCLFTAPEILICCLGMKIADWMVQADALMIPLGQSFMVCLQADYEMTRKHLHLMMVKKQPLAPGYLVPCCCGKVAERFTLISKLISTWSTNEALNCPCIWGCQYHCLFVNLLLILEPFPEVITASPHWFLSCKSGSYLIFCSIQRTGYLTTSTNPNCLACCELCIRHQAPSTTC